MLHRITGIFISEYYQYNKYEENISHNMKYDKVWIYVYSQYNDGYMSSYMTLKHCRL